VQRDCAQQPSATTQSEPAEAPAELPLVAIRHLDVVMQNCSLVPSQKDPQKERDSQQQRQGGTQQDPQRRPGQSEQDQDRDKDQQKDRKSA
jgi:hypothetical protein